MGFYSQVQITAEKNAFGMFEDILRKHGIRHRVLGTDGVKVISIDWVKWYPEFDSVREVEKAQRRLCADEYDMDGWGYKTIILNEDNSTEVYCNETGEMLFSDFEIRCEISNPYAIEDAGGGRSGMSSLNSLVAEGTIETFCTTEQTTSFDLRIKKHSGEISVPCLASGDTASLIGEQDEGRICRIFGHLDDYGGLAVVIERIEFKPEG